MAIELAREKYNGIINTVTIGTGPGAVKVGGQTTMPFLFGEGEIPNPSVVAFEILDCEPSDWPGHITKALGNSAGDPVRWAEHYVKDYNAKLLCLRLQGAHPDCGASSTDSAVSAAKAVSESIKVPLIVIGCGDDETDNEMLPKVSQALKGKNCLFGIASQSNYKTLAATCLADGHAIIAESPIDINIAKQVNILIGDMGFDASRIVMHPTTTSLGYGMEYVYSIMERARLAAFIGDKMLSMPFALFVGQEAWKAKEAKESSARGGINWEIATAVSMVQAGADIIVMRHPDAAKSVVGYIGSMMKR